DERLFIISGDLFLRDPDDATAEVTANRRRNEHRFILRIVICGGFVYRGNSASCGRARRSFLRGLGLGRAAREQSNNRKVANELFIHKKESVSLSTGERLWSS